MRRIYLQPRIKAIDVSAQHDLLTTSNPTLNTNPEGPVVGGDGPGGIEELTNSERKGLWYEKW